MRILVPADAALVAGVSVPGHRLDPVPLAGGDFMLPERTLLDSAHASKQAELQALPSRSVRMAEISAGLLGHAKELDVDGTLVPRDFFAEDGASNPIYAINQPSAFHVAATDTTWFVWEAWDGSARVVRWTTYNHTTGSWDGPYTCGTQTLTNDAHGAPAIVRDDAGRVHVLYGSHASVGRRSVTVNPDDPSSFNAGASYSSFHTYPSAHFLDGKIVSTYRNGPNNGNNSRYGDYLESTAISPTGVVTWGTGENGSYQRFVDFGVDARFYRGATTLIGKDIHMVFARSDAVDSYRRDVFYAVLSTTTKGLRNFGGSTSIPRASLPASRATLEASFRIFTHTVPNYGGVPYLAFDSAGNPHVLFTDSANDTEGDLMHMWHNGTAWSTPENIGVVAHTRVDPPAAFSYSDGRLGVLWIRDPGQLVGRGGDLYYRERAANGAWGTPELVRSHDVYGLATVSIIRDGPDAAKFVVAEHSGDEAVASQLRLFCYGADRQPLMRQVY